MAVWGHWTDRRRRQLKHDAREVLLVDRRGGTLMWRDDYTLIVSGCEQLSGEQLAMLGTQYPRAHFVVSARQSGTTNCGEGSGFVLTVTLLPDTCLAFSGMMLEFAMALALYGASTLLLMWS